MLFRCHTVVLVALCLGHALGLGFAADETPKVTIEFRRAETKAAEGLIEATDPNTKEKIYLHKTAEVTNADIAVVRLSEDKDVKTPALELVFTKEGAKKVAKLSAEHIDKPLAVLVNGKVLSAPIIRGKFSEKAVITGKFTKEELEKIVKAFNAK